MPDEDFDISSLARYLHLSPQQVDKLSKRGEIPSRVVGGKQRFSRAEVHHWMEARMGLLDDSELAAVEDRLQPADAERALTVAGLITTQAIAVPLKARTRNSVITAMTKLALKSGALWDAEKMADAVRAREDRRHADDATAPTYRTAF